MGIVKILQPTPLKLIKSKWEKLYLSREIEVSLSPNIISEKLRYIGSDWSAQREFFGYLLRGSKYLLFDLSSIVSYSENLKLAEKGYNAEHLYLKQIRATSKSRNNLFFNRYQNPLTFSSPLCYK